MNRLRLLLLSLSSLGWALPGTAQTAPSQWLAYDAVTKTVTFELVAGTPGTSGPLNFNGSNNGAATLVVPPGSSTVMNFVNLDGPPHSAELIADAEPMPIFSGVPGEGLFGMWIRFKVDPAATSPSWVTSPVEPG